MNTIEKNAGILAKKEKPISLSNECSPRIRFVKWILSRLLECNTLCNFSPSDNEII